MAQDLFDYPKMVETALRGVVHEALARAAREGLRGAHHFYLGFRTDAPGVVLPDDEPELPFALLDPEPPPPPGLTIPLRGLLMVFGDGTGPSSCS